MTADHRTPVTLESASSSLWMVSAPRGAGKTVFCRSLAGAATAAGWDVAGLLSPAVFANGVKTGIEVHDPRTGETRLLGRSSPAAKFDLAVGRWYFDPKVVEWGNEVLRRSLPCDLLIVDEVGPLELLQGAGWSAALSALRRAQYKIGVVVVRPELAGTARELLPISGTLPLPEDAAAHRDTLAYLLRHVSGSVPSQGIS